MQRERARKVARTSAAIETAALREVARRGYHSLRMTDVARRAHVAPRTLYLHATSKPRLVEQALRHRAAAQIARVERWRPRSEAPESVLNELVALHDRDGLIQYSTSFSPLSEISFWNCATTLSRRAITALISSLVR